MNKRLIKPKILFIIRGGRKERFCFWVIIILGSFFWIYGLAGNIVVRAEGKMKSAAVMMAFGLVVNIIANYILVGFMILPVIFMGMTFFPAIDKGKIGSIIGIVRQLFLYVPVMLIVPRFFGVSGVYYGSFGVELIVILLTVVLVKKEFALLKDSEELGRLAKNRVN